MQRKIIIFGAPGVGKGTYAKLLANDLNFTHLSPGDELRRLLEKPSLLNLPKTLENTLKKTISKGELVSDKLIFLLLENKLKEKTAKKGVVFDGFPRTVKQIVEFPLKIDVIVNILLEESILIEKLLGRRVCFTCGKSYNIVGIYRDEYDMEPLLPRKKENYCDTCELELQIREDDNVEVIRKRQKEYWEMAAPLLGVYRKQGVEIIQWEPKKGIKDYPGFFSEFFEKKWKD